jgi:hypothetical protein
MLTQKEKDQAGYPESSAEIREEVTSADSWIDEDPVPEDREEAGTLWILRIIPLVHGAVVGNATGELLLGLSGGIALSVVLDLFMGKDSLVRFLLRRLVGVGCPAISAAARRLAALIGSLGLPEPLVLQQMQCETPESP